MEDEIFPPLPDPAANQPPEARRAMGQRLIKQARYELASGDRLQAGGKAWGAAVQYLKIIGAQRGWQHTSNRQLQSMGSHLAAEFPEYGGLLASALADAYFKGHENFYENRRQMRDVREAVEGIEETIPILERLAEEPPRPFTIQSNSQLRRLRVLTGRDDLQVGDSSPIGFSMQEGYSRGQGEERVVRETGPIELPTLQEIIRPLMQTLLEDFPSLLTEEDIQDMKDPNYCTKVLGLKISNLSLLRDVGYGRQVSDHDRFYTRVYAGQYFVSNNWWADNHPHNAKALQAWVSEIIRRNEGHLGVAALQEHWYELNSFIANNNQ